MFAPKRILVPTDFSDHSARALLQAVDIASTYGARIYLLHVIEDLQQCSFDYCLSEELTERFRQESRKAVSDRLAREVQAAGAPRGVSVVAEIRQGVPYEGILKAEEERQIDLIVLGSHGKAGLLHNLLGGVAERIAQLAKCQVLLVK